MVQRERGQRDAGERARGERHTAQRAQVARAAAERRGGGVQRRQPLRGNARLQVSRRQAMAQGEAGETAAARAAVGLRGERDRLLIAVEDFRGDVRPGEALGALASGGGHARAQALIEREPAQRLRERERIAGRDQQAVEAVAQHVAVAGDVRGQHRRARRERLRQHHPEALTVQ